MYFYMECTKYSQYRHVTAVQTQGKGRESNLAGEVRGRAVLQVVRAVGRVEVPSEAAASADQQLQLVS